MPKQNPRELNPYMRNNGSGYPEDEEQIKSSKDQLLSSSVVGDGGASWRMKALKRAQEQATREGRNVKEVVQERWGSLGHLAASVASQSAAAPRAHLPAINSRRMGACGEAKPGSNNKSRRGNKKVSC
ncbi:CWF19-like protein 2 [Chenopodium quinoa]|uniref:CWF19-like protein 2 n=1 Tax=Chenopodium quinoa TaxID=63459 RepID=UPI000B79A802|nr:CWF19-like protein 2 [Chenopodium quinoa]